ncbi:MAG: hypothetical protein QOJ10_502 [Chloroflexota bacterium]|nr:hypothetical protein [Chloroflexota bacterium]
MAPPLQRRELSLKTINAACLLGFVSLAFALTAPTQAAADAPTDAAYRQAVSQTLALARSAQPNDTAAAHQALNVLEAGTGLSQPEVVADLQLIPPDFEDAINRLQALLAALTTPADTSDPAQAQQRLKDVLAMPRYDALHRPQSWLDRLRQWVSDRINDLLSIFFRQAGSSPFPDYFWYALGTIVVVGTAFLIFRSTRGRFTEGAVAAGPTGPRAPADYFAEADRYAAAGDRVRAIRALCAGVAATLAGERTWEGSPLTVREIFQHAPDPASLRPLLAPFEAAVYGGREVDAVTYKRALEVAEPFRRPSELAA